MHGDGLGELQNDLLGGFVPAEYTTCRVQTRQQHAKALKYNLIVLYMNKQLLALKLITLQPPPPEVLLLDAVPQQQEGGVGVS